MADNVAVTEGSGKTIASDDVGGFQYQRVKIGVGIDGSATDVSTTNPMPITVANSTGTLAVYVDSTQGTINVQLKPGTIAVSLDPGHLLGAVTANAGTGSFTVQFDPGHELGTIRGNTNTLTVFLPDTGHEIGTIRGNTNTLSIYIPDTGHELGSIRGITNSIAVHMLSTGGTIRVSMQDEPTVVASGKDGTTTRAVKMDSGGAIKIYDIVTGTINSVATVSTVTAVTNITNSIAVHVLSTGGTIFVALKPGTIAVSLDPGYTLGKVNAGTGTFSVSLDPGYTLGKVDQGNATTSGTQAWLTNAQTTASIFTVSGSTSGISVSGVTLVSPSANASFKVHGYSIQTTGAVSLTVKFTNGAGTGPTEFWRPLVTASGVTGVQGANLMSRPAAPLFVTGVSTTLALLLDTATLVHYSVSYTKESA